MNGRVHYSILNTNLPFTIDSSNGTVYTSRQLDRETADLYNVIIQAEDLALINPRSSTVRVSVELGLSMKLPQILGNDLTKRRKLLKLRWALYE